MTYPVDGAVRPGGQLRGSWDGPTRVSRRVVMSTAAPAHDLAGGVSAARAAEAAGPRRVWPTAVALCAVFFAAEHFLRSSVMQDYAPSLAEMEAAGAGGNLLRRAAFLFLAGVGAVGLACGRAGRWRSGGITGAVLLAHVAWNAASVAWAEQPGVSGRRFAVFLLFLVGAAGVARRFTGEQVVRLALWCVGLHLVLGVAAEFGLRSLRPWVAEYRFAGTLHPNIQALQLALGGVAAAVLAWRRPRHAVLFAAVFAALFLALFLTKSRTGTAGLLVALAGTLLMGSGPESKLLTAAGGLVAATAVFMGLLFTGVDFADEARDAALMGRDEQPNTLTGRLPIWEALDERIAARPWLGYGYLGFWSQQRVYAISVEVGWAVSASHSGWYEQTLSGGLIGAALLAAVLLAGMARCAWEFARTRDALPAWLFGALLCGFLNCFLEALVTDVRLAAFVLTLGLVKLVFLPDAAADEPAPVAAPPAR